MEYTSKDLEAIKQGDMFIDSRGLHIRMDTKTLEGFLRLREIAEAIRRPVDANGGAYCDTSFCWITIPLTKIIKYHSFGNQPPKRKNK